VLRHPITSDSASSTPDWISDSFCFFFSADRTTESDQSNQQSRCSPTESQRRNHIKQGNLAYPHRGRRQRCTCGRARRRPRSTAARSPRTPRSWLLARDSRRSRIPSLNHPAKTTRQRRVPTGSSRRRRRIRRTREGGSYVFVDPVRIAEADTKEMFLSAW
jgi:hypothetical protein